MRQPIASTQFRRDVKRIGKRGYDTEKLKKVIDLLVASQPLPVRCRDHALGGNWAQHRECHIAPDWLLIYRIEGNALYLVRTGTHADLFGK